MANLVFTRDLANNRYSLKVETSDLTPAETELINDFGEPDVVIGGLIDPSDPNLFVSGYTPQSTAPFTIAKVTKKIPSGFPYTITIDGNSNSSALANITDVQNHVERVIADAWNALKTQSDTWTVGSPETIPLP